MNNLFSISKRLLAVLMVLSMLGLCACKKSQTHYYSYYEDSMIEGTEDDSANDNLGGENQTDSDSSAQTGNSVPSGSGSSGQSGNKVPSAGKIDLNKIPDKLKNTTIFVYSWNDANAVSGAPDVIEAFTQKTGIKVDWKTGSFDNYATEIAAYVSSGKAPDVIRLKGFETSILSLMDPLAVSGYDFSDDIWDKNVLKYYTVYNYPYAVNRKNTLIQQPNVMFYNTSVISQYGFEDPYALWKQGKWTWDKFEEMIKDFHEETGYYSWSTQNFFDIVTMNGSTLVKRSGNEYINNMEDKKITQGLSKMVNLINAGCVDPIDLNYGGFPSGKNLFMSASCIGGRRTHFYFTSVKENNTIGMVPYPSVGGKYYQNFDEYEAYGIAKGAKNAEAVPYFLAYYLNGDNYDSSTFFPNAKMLDVYKWCMKQENVIVSEDRYIITSDTGVHFRNDFALEVAKRTNASDVTTLLNSKKSAVTSAVKYTNKRIEKLKID